MTSVKFAAAQQRVEERRRLRAADARTRVHSQRNLQASNALTQLPFPLDKLGQRGLRAWDTIKGREGTSPAYRVGQVDSELLDEELLELLKGQVGEGLKYFGSHIQDDWSSEILLGLRAVLFKLSIWDHNASYGAALQNLRYTDSRHRGPVPAIPTRWQKGLYGIFTIGGRYSWTKWEDWLADQDGGYEEPSANVRLLSRMSSIASTTHSIAAFASFLVFLVNGRYRTLLDRILRLKLAPPSSQISREVSFEYLNRQLVWHAFTEFLLFFLPLVGISRWKRWLSRAWRKTKALFKSDIGDEDEAISKGELAFLPERTCAICYEDQNPASTSEGEIMAISGASGGVVGSAQTDVTNPYETIPCGCIYCFVCIAKRLEAEEEEGWTCLRCGGLIKECRPWAGDVLEEACSTSNKKTVSFSDDEKKQETEEGSLHVESQEWLREESDSETDIGTNR
ncbi:MAG: peroxisome assembly protein (Peroxin-2) [Alectoria sarmentosa]|nr:MAG: peroxisome assembly protein (Peroxin-2) [Alectoria sarmentosa]